ncbi:hypothetical protein [Piscinibacter sp. XHJ-5]|uniref:hypothetical protein n=1 Tax=Piscinibacter sp. XHJ-5 TaxID=3037797 RepID=UPI002452A2E6|nr:hypothetical protein [Piscinibacter sp. XHJ-5]
MRPTLTAAALIAALAATLVITAAPAHAETEARALPAADYTVFVDPPTGFVFVKLPAGWKFAGKVEAADMKRLPSTVVTSLLVPDADMAKAAKSEALRVQW